MGHVLKSVPVFLLFLLVFFDCFDAGMSQFFFVFWAENEAFQFGLELLPALSLQVVDVGEHLPQFGLPIVGNFLLGGFQVLLQHFHFQVFDLFVSQVLHFLVHDPDYPVLLDADDVLDKVAFGSQHSQCFFLLLPLLCLSRLLHQPFVFGPVPFGPQFVPGFLGASGLLLLDHPFEVIDLILADVPEVMLCSLDELIDFTPDVALIEAPLALAEQADLDE